MTKKILRINNYQIFCLLLLGISVSKPAYCQRIENEGAIRKIDADHYFRFYYENDFIFYTDYYYTSGMNLELVKPSFKKNPLNKFFFPVAGAKMKYGIALDHYAFTPTHIIYKNILCGDRPYAGCLSINSFRIATDEKKKRQVSTSLIVGVVGPPALWKGVQTRLHKNLIPAPQPEGWDNQIKTDLILTYKVDLEKSLIASKYFYLNGNIEAIAGTLNDKLSSGLSLIIGKENDPFQTSEKISTRKWETYFFAHSFVSLIAYDGTMEGGMFDKKSPYTLSDSEIKRFTLQHQFGLMINIKKFYLELAENFLSKEFTTGLRHKWGSLGIAFELK